MLETLSLTTIYRRFGMVLFLTLLVFSPLVALAQGNGDKLSARVEYYGSRYLVGPGDVLSFKVLDEPEYTQEEILVRPDGTASFSGVGELYVNNASIVEITDTLTARLKTVLVEPRIMVTVANTRPVIVYLSGAVMKPGMSQFINNPNDKTFNKSSAEIMTRTDMRLFNVIANAGGLQMGADLSKILVKRGKGCEISANDTDNNICENRVVNLWKLLKEGDAEQDVMIYSGDSIYVPQLPEMAMSDEEYELLLRSDIGPKSFPVRVIGEVQAPGLVQLEGQSALLNTAVAKAGGYAPQAKRDVIAIRRFTNNTTFTTFFVDANKTDFTLRPNDVVFIAENKVYKAGRLMAEVAKIMSPFQSAAFAGMGASQAFGFGAFK